MIPAIPGSAGAFWNELCAAEAARKARENITREVKVRPQYRAASNDEPEPTFAAIHEQAQAEADRKLAESFVGKTPFVLDGGAR